MSALLKNAQGNYEMKFFESQFGMLSAYAEKCPSCERDRFDHDIMGNPCDAYLAFLKEQRPDKLKTVLETQRVQCERKDNPGLAP